MVTQSFLSVVCVFWEGFCFGFGFGFVVLGFFCFGHVCEGLCVKTKVFISIGAFLN